jgi:cytochrome oxidase Cu insertion factor (SCO1/SenC/PrrC family)
MKLPVSLLLLGLGTLLHAQAIYNNVDKPGDRSCDRVSVDTDQLNIGSKSTTPTVAAPMTSKFLGATPTPNNLTSGGMQGAAVSLSTLKVTGGAYFPKEQRKAVIDFAAVSESGKTVSINQLKGKVVLVGFWSARCDPSAKLLVELMDIYTKREKFNFEVLAVNFDENRPLEHIKGGWQAVSKFKLDNAKAFQQSQMPMYLPGIGKEGASNFLPTIDSLPLLCVVDPDGNLASMTIGYEPNVVATQLSRVLRERMPAPTK